MQGMSIQFLVGELRFPTCQTIGQNHAGHNHATQCGQKNEGKKKKAQIITEALLNSSS